MHEALKIATLAVLGTGKKLQAKETQIDSSQRLGCGSVSTVSALLLSATIAVQMPQARASLLHKALDVVTSVVPDQALIPEKLESGSEARANVARLTSELHWFSSLPEAEAEAVRQNKLVFWLHIRGDIDGKT